MTQIVLTEEQSRLLDTASGGVEILDHAGRLVHRIEPPANLDPRDEAIVEEIFSKRGQPQRTFPRDVVIARLNRLAGIQRTEGLNPERAQELLRRMQDGEAV